MSSRLFFRFVFFSLLLPLSPQSFALDYSWGILGNTFPSVPAACDYYLEQTKAQVSGVNLNVSYTFTSDTSAQCTVKFASNGAYYSAAATTRSGDGCTNPDIYNSSTGACDPPPKDCASEVGVGILARGSTGSVIESGGRRYVGSSPPSTACVDSCTYVSETSASTSCYLVSGSTDTGFCNYILTGNGQSCSGWDWDAPETGDPFNSPDTPDVPPSDPDDPGCSAIPGYVWSGTTCVKDPNAGDGDGDGGGDGGDGGDGGGGDGSGNGTGDGDGEGEDPVNAGKSSGNCDSPPTYSGDPLLGEILIQQWHTLCAGDELTPQMVKTGLQGEGLVDADTLDNVLAEDAENIDNQVSSIISGLSSAGPSSSCPVTDASVSTPWGVIKIPWSVNCPIFNVISAVIFYFSYLAAGWIVFNALARDD